MLFFLKKLTWTDMLIFSKIIMANHADFYLEKINMASHADFSQNLTWPAMLIFIW